MARALPRVCNVYPEGPSSQDLRCLAPKTILLMAFGTRVLKYWVLGPSGCIWENPGQDDNKGLWSRL